MIDIHGHLMIRCSNFCAMEVDIYIVLQGVIEHLFNTGRV